MMKLASLTILLALAASACTRDAGTAGARDSSAAGSSASAAPFVAGTALASPHIGPAGEWQMPAGDYANSRYSELAQITPANAKNLRAAWTFSTGVLRGHEGQPLVTGNDCLSLGIEGAKCTEEGRKGRREVGYDRSALIVLVDDQPAAGPDDPRKHVVELEIELRRHPNSPRSTPLPFQSATL